MLTEKKQIVLDNQASREKKKRSNQQQITVGGGCKQAVRSHICCSPLHLPALRPRGSPSFLLSAPSIPASSQGPSGVRSSSSKSGASVTAATWEEDRPPRSLRDTIGTNPLADPFTRLPKECLSLPLRGRACVRVCACAGMGTVT